ncbi:NAD(P)/FAD-dependent oxidoreductase [Leekyejoonella antrihumi]|uniref:FAD-binding oxidoreductase n=1 Tax=Leekyejoonella antrihumi TaxID=1660198 RepID=A0A563E8E1_9MICO|nr:FAD-dependent oxidoreductase [Leekyejoonella antrihumi]TWP38579.1 FAD-binding oxidoreductase [Leekyejoonella antrihumi]
MTQQLGAGANRPGWDDDPAVPAWTGHGPLIGAATADACVIGLGGSGLAAIEDLAHRGLSVIGLDAGRVAAAAAGRNGGFLSPGGAMSLSSTDSPVSLELRSELYRQTMAEQQRLADRLGPDVVRPTGALELAGLPGDPVDAAEADAITEQLASLRAEQEALASIGVKVEAYDGVLGQGFFTPDTALMNPVRRAFGLATTLPAGTTLHEHSPVTGVRAGLVTTAQGSVCAGVIIVAIDGKLELLLPQLAPVVQTMRLQMIATRPIAPGRLPCGVGYRAGYEWAQQDPAGRLLIGGGRDHFLEAETTFADDPTPQVQQWIDSAGARVAGEPVTVTHRWAASVGYTTDLRALCIPVDEGVVACGGYSGSGNLVGPIAARAAVALAIDNTPPPGYLRSSLQS